MKWTEYFGGFVLENEPTGGVFLGRFHGKVGSFHDNKGKLGES
jgi:hypothetical protein